MSATGFCVGCFPNCFSFWPGAVKRQTVFICFPPFSAFTRCSGVCLCGLPFGALVAHKRVSVEWVKSGSQGSAVD